MLRTAPTAQTMNIDTYRNSLAWLTGVTCLYLSAVGVLVAACMEFMSRRHDLVMYESPGFHPPAGPLFSDFALLVLGGLAFLVLVTFPGTIVGTLVGNRIGNSKKGALVGAFAFLNVLVVGILLFNIISNLSA